MYVCDWCKGEFEEAETVIETHSLDTPPYERISVCPYCGATDFKEINEYDLEEETDEQELN